MKQAKVNEYQDEFGGCKPPPKQEKKTVECGHGSGAVCMQCIDGIYLPTKRDEIIAYQEGKKQGRADMLREVVAYFIKDDRILTANELKKKFGEK
jgi:hypothetical protein